jgi:hypothetical protein
MITDISGRSLIRYCGIRKSIDISKLVEIIGDGCFSGCAWIKKVTFEIGSPLKVIRPSACRDTGLKVICDIPRTVKVISRSCFFLCECLEFVTFEAGSELVMIEKQGFS